MSPTKTGTVLTNEDEESLVSEVKREQDKDPLFLELKAKVHKQKVMDFEQVRDGVLRYQGRFCVPIVDDGVTGKFHL